MLFSLQKTRPAARMTSTTPILPSGMDPSVTPAIELLRPLLSAASELDPEDREGWIRLQANSRPVIGALVAGGKLPSHLAIGPDDAPVSSAGMLAAAWRHATAAWPQRQHRI